MADGRSRIQIICLRRDTCRHIVQLTFFTTVTGALNDISLDDSLGCFSHFDKGLGLGLWMWPTGVCSVLRRWSVATLPRYFSSWALPFIQQCTSDDSWRTVLYLRNVSYQYLFAMQTCHRLTSTFCLEGKIPDNHTEHLIGRYTSGCKLKWSRSTYFQIFNRNSSTT